MFLSFALGALLVIFVLLRQVRVRPVPRLIRLQLPIIIGVIGLFELSSYASSHHNIAGSAWAWVLGTLVVGAVGFGVLRGLTVKVWTAGNWVLRQGTAITMALWLVSLAIHFAGDVFGAHAHDGSGLESASFLLYLGLTLGVQTAVVHRRALPLWAELGPDAGRRLQFTMSQTPDAGFTFFRTGAGPGGADPWNGGSHGADHDDDPNVIDAEVVEDDDHGPPELHAPG